MTLTEFADVVLRRQRRILMAVFLAAFAVAAALTVLLPKQYSATATLLVNGNQTGALGSSAFEANQALTSQFGQLAGGPEIRDEAAQRLPFPESPGDLAGAMSFTVSPTSQVIEVTATDRSPARAKTMANTYAAAFVRNRTRSAEAAGRARLRQLNRQVVNLAAELDRLQAAGGVSSASRIEGVRNRLSAARAAYLSTEQGANAQAASLSVASAATLPSSPSRPKPALYLIIGGIFAALLAVGAALVRNAFDDRVRTEAELVDLLDLPVLAHLPAHRARRTLFDEEIRFLRMNILARNSDSSSSPLRAIAVTSALPGEGKTHVSAALLRSFEADRRAVVGIDCDLRRPILSERFQASDHNGVAEALDEGQAAPDLLVDTPSGLLQLLAAGQARGNPASLMTGHAVRQMFLTLMRSADVLVIDTPPVISAPEASTVCSSADAVVLVVDIAMATRDNLVAALAQLRELDSNVVGLVLNRTRFTRSGYALYGSQMRGTRRVEPSAPARIR